jgi:hypothetical protein
MGPHTNLDVSDKIKFLCTKREHLQNPCVLTIQQFDATQSGYRLRVYILYLKKLTSLQAYMNSSIQDF